MSQNNQSKKDKKEETTGHQKNSDEKYIEEEYEEEEYIIKDEPSGGFDIERELRNVDNIQKKKIDEKKKKRKDSDERKVAESVLDVETRTTLFELRKRKVIDYMTGIISSGKEANVYHAYAPDGKELAVKVYRTSTSVLKGLQVYILGDQRFANIKKSQRSFVHAWAKKEFKNLSRAINAGIPVPKPIICKKDVVVMEFLGKDSIPYPLLKDEHIDEPKKTYLEIVKNMKKLYEEAKLIHADLSEYNIMYTPDVYFIDISQGVLLEHVYAEVFLYRDVKNITRYFNTLLDNIYTHEELFEEITGLPPSNRVKTFEFR